MVQNIWTLPSGAQAIGSPTQEVTNASDITTIQEVAAVATGVRTATSSVSAAPLGGLGLSLVIRRRGDATPNPGGGTGGGGTEQTYVKVGTATFLLTATNPTDTTYPGGRGPNQLIKYQSPITTTATNQWGVEVQVNSSNVVTAVNNRLSSGSTSGTAIPSGGYVLSGHGDAASWLLANAIVGATIEFTNVANPNPGGGGGGGGGSSTGIPAKMVAVYGKIWSSDTTNFGSYPAGANLLLPSFFQGDPPNMVGWGSIGKTAQLAAIAARRSAGDKIVLSVGGGGAVVNTTNRTQFVNQFDYWVQQYEGNVDGLDWDIEGTQGNNLNPADVLWINQYLKNKYGPNFIIMMAPNGTTISHYITMGKQNHDAGVLDCIGMQFYDAPVSLAAAKSRISQIVGAGIPQSKVSVGMMIGNDANHWTNAQCVSYMQDIRNTWPGITKVYLWMEPNQMSTTNTWVSDMRTIVGL